MGLGRVVPGVLALSLLVACSNTPVRSVPMPPSDATPARVLTTYLQALRAGDCPTARALGTSTFVPGNGELCGHLTVKANTPLGTPAERGDGEVIFSTVLTTDGGDDSMPDGDHIWFYSLKRQPAGMWRLIAGGSGP
jgi:hypothetical protein